MGIDQISLTNSFDLVINIDPDYILEIQSRNIVPAVRVAYLTIGEKTYVVCSECDNFIFRDSCLDICPENTYEYYYPNGGQSCLTCSPKVF